MQDEVCTAITSTQMPEQARTKQEPGAGHSFTKFSTALLPFRASLSRFNSDTRVEAKGDRDVETADLAEVAWSQRSLCAICEFERRGWIERVDGEGVLTSGSR